GHGRPWLVVRDGVPKRRADADLEDALAEVLTESGMNSRPLVLPPAPDGLVHADLEQVEWVRAAIVAADANVLAVGSGSVVDVCKEATGLVEREGGHRPALVLFPTANSVTAFGSSLAVLLKAGAKRSFPGRYPDAVVLDLPTLAAAPPAMT